jgi:hypothetical protein
MKPAFFEHSVMAKAWQVQKEQPFGKDNTLQSFTTEPVFFHITLPILKQGFLDADDMDNLFRASSSIKHLWSEYEQVKDLDWMPLCEPNPDWQTQERIDPHRVDLRMACLFHFDMDLAVAHRCLGSNHVIYVVFSLTDAQPFSTPLKALPRNFRRCSPMATTRQSPVTWTKS